MTIIWQPSNNLARRKGDNMNKLNTKVLIQGAVTNELNTKFNKLGLNLTAHVYNDYICVEVDFAFCDGTNLHKNNMYIPAKVWKTKDLEKIFGYVFSRV